MQLVAPLSEDPGVACLIGDPEVARYINFAQIQDGQLSITSKPMCTKY